MSRIRLLEWPKNCVIGGVKDEAAHLRWKQLLLCEEREYTKSLGCG